LPSAAEYGIGGQPDPSTRIAIQGALIMSSPYQPPYRQPPTNGLGIAGFIVSLVGLVATCGVLCPLGLLLSLFGLLKRPRGFAIAGTLIGLVGTAFIACFVGLFAAAVVSRVHQAELSEKAQMTADVLAEAEQIIDTHYVDHGKLPDGIEGNKLLVELSDGWGGSIRYDREDDQRYLVRSPGEDGEFDSDDDVTTGLLQGGS
jgi:hypothetical protein